MHRISHLHVFAGLALLWLILMAAEAWLLVRGETASANAALVLAQKRREAEMLGSLDPAPTAAQAACLEARLASAENVMAGLQAEFAANESPADVAAEKPGAQGRRAGGRSDAGGLIRDLRERARRAGVGLRPEEQFGLAAADGAPAPVAARRRQCEAVGAVLRALLASRPSQLISVQCACPAAPEADLTPPRRPQNDTAAGAGDFPDFDPRLSMREAGMIETVPIRLTFTGLTPALRGFLNRIAAGGHLVAVSDVAVEPALSAGPSHGVKSAGAEAPAPIVRPVPSRFTITMEFCEFVAPPVAGGRWMPGATAPAGAAHPDRIWPAPALQGRGRGWLYEVFTPPAIFCDAASRALAAVPACEAAPADQEDVPPDLQLLRVRRKPFRLRLVGFAGGPDDLRGIFADTASGRTIVGRAGDRLAGCRVLLKRIGLDRSDPDGRGAIEPVARAEVDDEGTGEEIVLTTRGPSPAGAPIGLFASRKSPASRREFKEGDSAEFDGVGYRIERVELEPALAVVACMPGGSSEATRRAFILQIRQEAPGGVPAAAANGQNGRDSPMTP